MKHQQTQKKMTSSGSFSLSPIGPFRACTYVTLSLVYSVGPDGFKEGGRIKFGLPNMGWSEPLVPYIRGDYELYSPEQRQVCRFWRSNTTCRVESKHSADIRLYSRGSQNLIGPYVNWTWWITAILERGELQPGETITVVYGDTSVGEKGAYVQPWIERDRVYFTAFVDCTGTGEYVQVDGSPVVCEVVPGPFTRSSIVVPSITENTAPVRIALTDEGWDAISSDELERIRDIHVYDAQGKRIPLSVSSDCASLSVSNVLVAGPQRIRAEVRTEDEQIIRATANPSVGRENGERLLWGDLHCHSYYHQYNPKLGYGDPSTSPDELMRYVREVALLDFMAITDGSGAMPENAGWKESQQAALDHHRDGEFTVFKGWEIQYGLQGHRNAIYRDAVIEDHYTDPAFSDITIFGEAPKNSKGMQAAVDYFKGRDDILLIPHHSMTWIDWNIHDPNLDRLVEIYSCWGSSEAPDNDYWDKASLPGLSVVEALDRGYKLGFVGGSDTHTGFPGRSINHADRYEFVGWKAGYTGVYAADCTREAIFDALKNRRCYATTGARIIVRFSVDGACMGEIMSDRSTDHVRPAESTALRDGNGATDGSSGSGSHLIRFSIIGTEKIRLLEIIRDGVVVYSIEPYLEEVTDEWIDKGPQAAGASYYYLRVTQTDDNRAWASPVWV